MNYNNFLFCFFFISFFFSLCELILSWWYFSTFKWLWWCIKCLWPGYFWAIVSLTCLLHLCLMGKLYSLLKKKKKKISEDLLKGKLTYCYKWLNLSWFQLVPDVIFSIPFKKKKKNIGMLWMIFSLNDRSGGLTRINIFKLALSIFWNVGFIYILKWCVLDTP